MTKDEEKLARIRLFNSLGAHLKRWIEPRVAYHPNKISLEFQALLSGSKLSAGQENSLSLASDEALVAEVRDRLLVASAAAPHAFSSGEAARLAVFAASEKLRLDLLEQAPTGIVSELNRASEIATERKARFDQLARESNANAISRGKSQLDSMREEAEEDPLGPLRHRINGGAPVGKPPSR